MELNKAIQSRKSVRQFIDKKPDWRDIIEAIDATRYAPMAGNNYTVKFILVDDKEKIQKLADAAQQSFVAQVYYIVVVCSYSKRTINAYEERGKIYCRQQAGAAIENFLLKLTDLGLATCWIGAFVESIVKRTLKIPDDVDVEAIFPIGYELSIKGAKHRRKEVDIDSILFFNEYKNKKMKSEKRLDV